MSPAAYRRAVTQGNGWYGFFQNLDATAEAIAGLEEAAKKSERPASLGELEISITPPPGGVDPDTVRRYEDLGVSRLILLPGAPKEAAASPLESGLRYLEEIAELLKLA